MNFNNKRLIGKGIIILLVTSLFLLFGIFQGNISTVHAASGTYDEDFTTTTYMDGAETNSTGWGTGSIENSKKKPTIVGSISNSLIGNTLDVFLAGDYAYITNEGEGLKIVNIIDSTNPFVVGSFTTPGNAQSVFVNEDFAFIADHNGDEWGINFQIVNITDSTNPIPVGNCSTFDFARAVVVDGNYAYVANSESGLSIIDISDPTNPSQIRARNTAGISYSLVIVDNYLYLADGTNGLVVIDISTPLTPTIITTYNAGISSAIDVVVEGNYLFIIDINNGIQLLNINNPATPIFVGLWSKTNVVSADIYGDYLYVTGITNGLSIVNITYPTTPTIVTDLSLIGTAVSIVIDDVYAYITCQSGGFHIIQIAEVMSPSFIGSYDTAGFSYNVFTSGDFAYIADGLGGLQILDITNPFSPSFISTYDTTGESFDVVVTSGYAYVADGDSGLQILNISDPSSPSLVGSYDTSGESSGIFISNNLAYLADGNSGLQILDISDPSSPSFVGSYDTMGHAQNVFVSGNYAYIADIVGSVILDISDPSSPTFAASTPFLEEHESYDVFVYNNHAYLTDNRDGLQVFDVSNPSSPVDVGTIDVPYSYPKSVIVSGDFVYLSTPIYGFSILDISNLASPIEVGNYHTPGQQYGFYISGDNVYIADFDEGLQILEIRRSMIRQFTSINIAQSNLIYSLNAVTLMSATLIPIDSIPSATYIDYYLSADNGVNWEQVTSGIRHDFINMGNQLKWKAVLITSNALVTPMIHDLSINYTTSLNAPSLINPINNHITDDYTPTFSWSGINGENFYLFQLDNTTSFTDPLLNITLPSSSTSYALGSVLTPDTYYWRVAGIDSENDIGTYSNYRTIYIIEDTNSPVIDQSDNVTYEVGEIGNSITWNPSDTNPYYYNITRNTTLLEHGITWDGGSITIDIDSLTEGVYNFTCYVFDHEGLFAWDSVFVSVELPVIGEFTHYPMMSVLLITTTLVVIYSKRKRKTHTNV